MFSRRFTRSSALALCTVAFGVGGVSVAAATGSLPSSAQHGLAVAASHVGITLPASHDNHPDADAHPESLEATSTMVTDEPSTSTESTSTTMQTTSTTEVASSTVPNHGQVVSPFAHTTTLTGRAKGQAIAQVARDNHGHNR
jgi:hypothetical protein